MHNCCNNYTRSQLLRSAAAEAGRGLPAIEPGMPEPAGTGLSRRSFLSRSAGLALAVYGASKIPLAAFEEGIAQAAPTRQDPRLGLLRRRHRRAQRARAGRRPALLAAAAEPGARPRRRDRHSAEDPTPALAPVGRRRWRPCTARARSAPSRRSATTTPTSRTSPRATTTRSASSTSASTPAGWAATSTRSATTTTRCRGSRWTARSRR